MKKNILVALAILGVVASAYSQGTVTFNNLNSASGIKAPIYGPEVGDASKVLQGNTATGLPAGTTVYTGSLLSGTTFSAQIWGGPAGSAESALQGALPITSFRTGSAAGYVTATTATLANVPKDAASAVLQLRVWDNAFGATWDAATGAKGKSALFTVNSIGGDINTPPLMTGLQSFNIAGGAVVPEPSTFALAGLGAAALLIFRRRK